MNDEKKIMEIINRIAMSSFENLYYILDCIENKETRKKVFNGLKIHDKIIEEQMKSEVGEIELSYIIKILVSIENVDKRKETFDRVSKVLENN